MLRFCAVHAHVKDMDAHKSNNEGNSPSNVNIHFPLQIQRIYTNTQRQTPSTAKPAKASTWQFSLVTKLALIHTTHGILAHYLCISFRVLCDQYSGRPQDQSRSDAIGATHNDNNYYAVMVSTKYIFIFMLYWKPDEQIY